MDRWPVPYPVAHCGIVGEKGEGGNGNRVTFKGDYHYDVMISDLIKKHEEYRLTGLNLVASENQLSKGVQDALSCDLVGRYGNEWYGGSQFARELCTEVEKLAQNVFRARYAFITPLSGNICDLAALFAFTQAGDMVASLAKEDGGYPLGYEKFQRKLAPLPLRDGQVDVPLALRQVGPVKLTILGSSVLLFPHPVAEFACNHWGTLAYDGSHVLGLIAGGEFQDPLREGAHILMGSTHKTFPGPQGGIMLTNSPSVATALKKVLCFSFDDGIGLVDNPHLHRIAALGMALQEMLDGGKEYARQTIRNASALARALDSLGVPVKYAPQGFTRSHQVLLNLSPGDAHRLCHRLENHKIFIDISGRVGVAEVTHLGMKEQEMGVIADLISRIYHRVKVSGITRDVERMANAFTLR